MTYIANEFTIPNEVLNEFGREIGYYVYHYMIGTENQKYYYVNSDRCINYEEERLDE
jgi:hypothetical protein